MDNENSSNDLTRDAIEEDISVSSKIIWDHFKCSISWTIYLFYSEKWNF